MFKLFSPIFAFSVVLAALQASAAPSNHPEGGSYLPSFTTTISNIPGAVPPPHATEEQLSQQPPQQQFTTDLLSGFIPASNSIARLLFQPQGLLRGVTNTLSMGTNLLPGVSPSVVEEDVVPRPNPAVSLIPGFGSLPGVGMLPGFGVLFRSSVDGGNVFSQLLDPQVHLDAKVALMRTLPSPLIQPFCQLFSAFGGNTIFQQACTTLYAAPPSISGPKAPGPFDGPSDGGAERQGKPEPSEGASEPGAQDAETPPKEESPATQ